ncbi:MAG TPA: MFS transporter [Candidatus Dormibacteraeota bacterium]|jgi:NNP family nitrate/nitrite transporter-like MFS transporter|nr:MFS transporter [Candidatus Dormibacteraeota bacterium]
MSVESEIRIEGSGRRALGLATLAFFGGFAGVAIFGPMVPRFTSLLHLTPLEAGVLASIPNLTGSLLRIPFGAWVDRVGGRRPLTLLLGLTLVGMAGLLTLLRTAYPERMDGTFPLLLALGGLIGCGVATFSVGIAQVSYWFPRERQGGPLGVFAGLGNTSPGLSSWLLPVAAGSLGLLSAYGLWFLALLIITVVYAWFIRDAPWFQLRRWGGGIEATRLPELEAGPVPSGSTWHGLELAAREPATWALVFFYFVSFGGFLALTAWLPTYWHAVYAVSLTTGGLLTLVFSLLTALVRVPGGLLSDRLSIRYALAGNFALMLVASLVAAFSQSFGLSLAALVGIALGMGLQNAIVFKLLPRFVPHAVGGASGWVGGLGALGGFVLPPIMGSIAGAMTGPIGYERGFLVFSGLVVLGLAVTAWLARQRRSKVPAPRGRFRVPRT